jgi:hypothetical protein
MKDPGLARILLRAQQLNDEHFRSRRMQLRRRLIHALRRESMATLMTGSGSIALAFVIAIPLVADVPSPEDPPLLILAGLYLGGAGVAISLWQKSFSWMSALGCALIGATAICVLVRMLVLGTWR